jgi:hypothetical protein
MAKSQSCTFDGGAGTFLGTSILAFLVTLLSRDIRNFWVPPRIAKWVVKKN